jgi:predicted peptidase
VAILVAACTPSAGGSIAATATPRLGLEIHAADPSNGIPLGFVSYVPPGGGSSPRPLLVFLHGSAESGDGSALEVKLLLSTAIPWLIASGRWPAERPFIVLAPQHDAAEIPCFTPDEIEGFIQRSVAAYPVDPKRIYLTGLSCGAIGAWDYLAEHTNEQVAAAVLIAGDGRHALAVAGCSLGVVPIWAFHGDLDTNVGVEGSTRPIAALQACTTPKAVDARIHVFENAGHNVWDRTYGLSAGFDIYAWMLGHARP